jgi:hypothetical protein
MFSTAAPNTEILGNIDVPLPDATGIVAAGVGMRGDPGAVQPGVINIDVPGTPVKAFLYWEGQMEEQASPGDNQLTVKVNGGAATGVTGTFIGGEPTKIAPIGDEWTSSYRAEISGLVNGANTVEVSDMDFDSRCPDCRNDGASVIVLYDDGSEAGTVRIKEGNDLAWIGFVPPYNVTVPQTFNFPADPDEDRTATLVIATGSVSNPERPNIICVSIDGGPATEHPDEMGEDGGPGYDDWDTVTLNPVIPAGATSLTVELKSAQATSGSIWPPGSNPASMVWVAGGLYVPPATVPLGCRVTGGLVDESSNCYRCPTGSSGNNTFTAGGQAGANTALPDQPKGEWTHHQKKGPGGKFVFHAGTASAPEGTEIDWIECMDPENCNPARKAPAKQIDFGGVGTFKNLKGNPPDILDDNIEVGVSLHYFEVNIDDLGEPGKSGFDDPDTELCPENGFGIHSDTEFAECGCPDFYRITIWSGPDPGSDFVIYEASGYIKGGNFQIHPLTGYDRPGVNPDFE